MRCVFVSTEEFWSNGLFTRLKDENSDIDWIRISDRLSCNSISASNADWAFFFRWPHIVGPIVHENVNCVTFHTANLPWGRGGSPIQNQIMDGILNTNVNALKMNETLDGGPVYVSTPVTIQGSANDIWSMLSSVVFDQIVHILETPEIKPIPQNMSSTSTLYRRRANNDLAQVSSENIEKVYRFIQMLDGPGYPNAYLDFGNLRLTLSRAGRNLDGNVLCDAKIEVIDV